MSNHHLPTIAEIREFYETSDPLGVILGSEDLLEQGPDQIYLLAVQLVRQTSDLNVLEARDLLRPIQEWSESFFDEEDGWMMSESSKSRFEKEFENGVCW